MDGSCQPDRLLESAVEASVDSDQLRVRMGEPPSLAAGILVPAFAVEASVDGDQLRVRRVRMGEPPLLAAGILVPDEDRTAAHEDRWLVLVQDIV